MSLQLSLRMPLQLSLRGAKRRGNLQHYDPVRLPRRFAPRNDVIGYEFSLKQGPTVCESLQYAPKTGAWDLVSVISRPDATFIWYLYVSPDADIPFWGIISLSFFYFGPVVV